jgi:hypothetical protein
MTTAMFKNLRINTIQLSILVGIFGGYWKGREAVHTTHFGMRLKSPNGVVVSTTEKLSFAGAVSVSMALPFEASPNVTIGPSSIPELARFSWIT